MTVIRETSIPRLPPRQPGGHKGTYGRVLIVAGSRGMSGAACLAGKSALRGGAGLVTVAVPSNILPVVASYEPAYLTLPLADQDGALANAATTEILSTKTDVLAVGPGLSQRGAVGDVIRAVVSSAPVPMVIDADGLNSLVGQTNLLAERQNGTILSPHPGEFARLTGRSIGEIQAHREELATRFAADHQVVLILKGSGTVVTDGTRLAVNATGNPGMATGGTGDVLTGLLAALLAQGLQPFEAARLAVHIHGLAGDLVAQAGSPISLIASDLLDAIPVAWRTHQGAEG